MKKLKLGAVGERLRRDLEISLNQMASMLDTRPMGGQKICRDSSSVFVNTDSRTLRRRQVFWAIKGDNFDGHDFVRKAFDHGCRAAVVSRDWFEKQREPGGCCLPVADTIKSLLVIARKYGDLFHIPKIALTGSNGKTTTKDMLTRVLSARGRVLSTHGNLNNHIGVPLTLFGLNNRHRFAVVEMGTNHPGEIRPLAETAGAQTALITNIGFSHTANLGSPEGVFREKREIMRGFRRGALLVVNADDKFLSRLRPPAGCRKLTFGIKNGDFRAEDLQYDDRGRPVFRVNGTKYRLRVPGTHNVYNALAALTVGTEFGVPKRAMASVLSGFRTGAMRMQIIKTGGVTIINDCYNANPGSMKSALWVLRKFPTKGRRCAVLGDMLELGPEGARLHNEVGQIVAESGVDRLLGFGDLAGSICLGAISAGLKSSQARHYHNFPALLHHLIKWILPGDVILLKGSRGMRLERVATALKGESHG